MVDGGNIRSIGYLLDIFLGSWIDSRKAMREPWYQGISAVPPVVPSLPSASRRCCFHLTLESQNITFESIVRCYTLYNMYMPLVSLVNGVIIDYLYSNVCKCDQPALARWLAGL